MAKGKRSSGNGEAQYAITQANLDRKGKTNKKVKRDQFLENVKSLGYINAINKYYSKKVIIVNVLRYKLKRIIKIIIGRK